MAKTKRTSSSTKKIANKKGSAVKKGLKPKSKIKSPKGVVASKVKKIAIPKQKATSNQQGPISLDEAQVLLSAQSPPKASKRSLQPVAEKTTLATIGKQRERLEKQDEMENERRIREYAALITLMKERGVKAPTVKKHALTAPAGVRSISPLQVFAEGDSWFDYPYPFFGGGVIPRLQSLLGVPILNLAQAGDEVRNMLGVTARQIIEKQLRSGSPTGDKWDAMLFSGGGNDIVGDPLALWIRDFDSNVPLVDLLHSARFETALGLVRAGYEDLIAIRNKLSPTTHLVFHAYDFAIPDGRGVCNLGPWMKPAFDVRKFPNQSSAFEVVKAMLKRFALMLDTLAQSNALVTLINAQGTLNPQASSWHNELHPSSAGFQTMAKVFRDRLKALFPTKVP
jgi:hypothetical protein